MSFDSQAHARLDHIINLIIQLQLQNAEQEVRIQKLENQNIQSTDFEDRPVMIYHLDINNIKMTQDRMNEFITQCREWWGDDCCIRGNSKFEGYITFEIYKRKSDE